jgi:hypothetical protein
MEMIDGVAQPFSPELRPQFAPRDSLGLYVSRARASFRRAVVEPLP